MFRLSVKKDLYSSLIICLTSVTDNCVKTRFSIKQDLKIACLSTPSRFYRLPGNCFATHTPCLLDAQGSNVLTAIMVSASPVFLFQSGILYPPQLSSTFSLRHFARKFV